MSGAKDWIVDELLQCKKSLSFVVLWTILFQSLLVAFPIVSQILIDRSITNYSSNFLFLAGLALFAIAVFECAAGAARSLYTESVSTLLFCNVSQELFRRLVRLPMTFFYKSSSGESLSRMNELQSVRMMVSTQTVGAVFDTTFSVFALIILAFYSTALSISILLSLVLLYVPIRLVSPHLRTRYTAVLAQASQANSFLIQMFNGIETIKGAGVENIVAHRWNAQVSKMVAAQMEASRLSIGYMTFVNFFVRLSSIAVTVLGIVLVSEGEISLGTFVAFIMLSHRMLLPLTSISQAATSLLSLRPAYDRLSEIFTKSDKVESVPSGRFRTTNRLTSLRLSNLSFGYSNDRLILKGINLDVRAGEVIALVGPSGAGKSTLLKLICGFLKPSAGHIYFDDVSADDFCRSWFREHVGIVPQDPVIFQGSITENIKFWRDNISNEDVQRAAELAGVDLFAQKFQHGYDAKIGPGGMNLSGGERQRIAIARAIAVNPSILLFDEPTSALDHETEKRIFSSLPEISKNRLVLIVTHRVPILRFAHKIYSINGGGISKVVPGSDCESEGWHSEFAAS